MKEFDNLIDIVKKLRGENGCPWDRKQTLETLKFPLIEETYEVLEAMDFGGNLLKEELGDLILQIVFQAEISEEKKEFAINDVLNEISEKLIRRHPHVFANKQDISTEQVLKNWEEIKKHEKNHLDRKSVLDGIPKALPSIMKAEKLQKKASNCGFDWENIDDVIKKIEEELQEVKEAIKNEKNKDLKPDTKGEIGDLLFSTINLSRFLNINASDALNMTNKKFEDRFKFIEENCDIKNSDLKTMEEFWQKSKNRGL
ncbi:MAG: nucleoside triphosphate pyrophosphohydrolase [Fusobacteriaceae bacterium]|jgi:XTP/dITP diphosphohydrolase/tetrapyrrole methylase family protein/MazG family protein|nr:nucleoside triphosphate pyrophosphohydrolase [Fusobacteriaceae bacterium]